MKSESKTHPISTQGFTALLMAALIAFASLAPATAEAAPRAHRVRTKIEYSCQTGTGNLSFTARVTYRSDQPEPQMTGTNCYSYMTNEGVLDNLLVYIRCDDSWDTSMEVWLYKLESVRKNLSLTINGRCSGLETDYFDKHKFSQPGFQTWGWGFSHFNATPHYSRYRG